MDDVSSEERKSVVEESSALVLSLLKRDGDRGIAQSLSERVRRLSERAPQKGLECSSQALFKWLSNALKGGAGPVHRWCGKEDALPDLLLVISESQGVLTADPQCVWQSVTLKNGSANGAARMFARLSKNYEASARDAKHTSKNLVSGRTDSIRVPRIYAKRASPFHSKRRSVSTNTLSVTFTVSLVSLGKIVRQGFARLAIPTWSLLQLLVLLGGKDGGSRTIAILHTTYRLAMRLVSRHIR